MITEGKLSVEGIENERLPLGPLAKLKVKQNVILENIFAAQSTKDKGVLVIDDMTSILNLSSSHKDDDVSNRVYEDFIYDSNNNNDSKSSYASSSNNSGNCSDDDSDCACYLDMLAI